MTDLFYDVTIYKLDTHEGRVEFKESSIDFVMGLYVCKMFDMNIIIESNTGNDIRKKLNSKHIINPFSSDIPKQFKDRFMFRTTHYNKLFETKTLTELSTRWRSLINTEAHGVSGKYTCFASCDNMQNVICIFDSPNFLNGLINGFEAADYGYIIPNIKIFNNYELCYAQISYKERPAVYRNDSKYISDIMINLLPNVLCNIVIEYYTNMFLQMSVDSLILVNEKLC
jgi:hypothetical protein